MEEHLTAGQIAEFILGGLDEDELKAVYRHFDECVDCVEWLAGVIRAEAYECRPSASITAAVTGPQVADKQAASKLLAPDQSVGDLREGSAGARSRVEALITRAPIAVNRATAG